MDKRETNRVAADFYLNKVFGDEVYMCRASDISRSGLFLTKLIEPQLTGARVQLEFALPDCDEVIWAGGEVVREVRQDGRESSGIRFTSLPAQHEELIHLYVESHLHDRHPEIGDVRLPDPERALAAWDPAATGVSLAS